MSEHVSARDYGRSPHPIDYWMGVDEYIGGPDTDVPDPYVTTGIYSDQVSLTLDEESPADNVPTIHELRSQYDELVQTTAEPLAKVQAAVVVRGESFGEIFSQYVAVYTAENNRQPHDYERELLKIDALSQTATELDHSDIVQLINDAGALLADACATEEALLPSVFQTLNKTKSELVRTTDWDAVVTKAAAEQDYASLGEHIALVACEHHYDDYGLQAALTHAEYVISLQQQVVDNGDRVPDGGVYIVSGKEDYAATLPEDMRKWSDETYAAITPLSNARLEYITHIDPSKKLAKIYDIAIAAGLGGKGNHAAVAPEIAQALHAHAETLINTFECADAAWVRQRMAQPLGEITIEGDALATERIGILDVPSWVRDRLHRYPTHMVHGLRGIRFIDNPDVRIVDGQEVRSYGSLGRDDGIVEVNVHTRSLVDAHDSLDHEIWHNVEKNMTLSELRAWAHVCLIEPGNGLDGVPPDLDPAVQNSESLAYCGEVYMNEPLNLIERGLHGRFKFLQRRVGRYPTGDLRIQTAFIDLNGHTARNIAEANRTLVRAADRATERSWQQAA